MESKAATDEKRVASGGPAAPSAGDNDPTPDRGTAAPSESHDAAPSPSPVTNAAEAQSLFGSALEAVLQQQCGEQLSDVHWFRTDWQRGGALTGYAKWHGEDGQTHDAMIKMPVPPRERLWLQRLQSDNGTPPVVPRLYAHGAALGGYDLAWVVMERLPHGPIGQAWGGEAFALLVDAAARFYAEADRHAIHGEPLHRDWGEIIKKARSHISAQNFPDAPRWKNALKNAQKKSRKWQQVWEQRPVTDWVHGDLHLGNAMTRCQPPEGPAVLFDLAHVRPGNWVEDAVYVEHIYWSHPEKLDGHRITAELAKARKEHGLAVDPDWPRLAQVKRALFAASAPVTMHHEGGRHHLHAALEVLEREVG